MERGTSVTAIAIATNREQCIRKLVVSFYCQSICKSAVTREAISTYWEFLKVASGFRTILHSKDDGEHWQPQTSGITLQLSSVCASASQLWIVGDNGTILHSADGGQHWQSKASGTGLNLSSVYASGSQLWTVGENGIVLHSTDGGLNWQPQTRSAAPHLLAVCSVGSKLWTVGYGGVILHSANGGRTWQRQSLPFG